MARHKKTVDLPDLTAGSILMILTKEVLGEENVPGQAMVYFSRNNNSLTFQWDIKDGDDRTHTDTADGTR